MRLIVLFLLLQTIMALGNLLYSMTITGSYSALEVGFQIFVSVIYFLTFLGLFSYSDRIAERISKGLPENEVTSPLNSTQVFTLIIAGVAMYVGLSSISSLIFQLNGILNYYWSPTASGLFPRKTNDIFFGFVGTLVEISVATIVFVKSKRLAKLWERWQSADR